MRKLFSFALLFVATLTMQAQQMPQMPPVPNDPQTRVGKLDNGLTYYIRHNEHPEHVANFYIAQRVGSIQEEDSQRGLAHFLEHMAFNGSTHFKGNELIEYCRSIGVAFGQDLNAYTSIEQTVYNIDNVPTARQSSLDSCLYILQDWSNGLQLLPEEIDKERGVIHGEWAMRNSPMQRLLEQNLPALYPGSRYGYRMPIGTMEIVDNFKPKELVDYYHKWYHPENQAIIVIGDVDIDHIEAKIKELFSGIKAGANAAHVEPIAVPDNDEAIFVFGKDKEMQNTQFSICMKSEPLPRELRGTMMAYIQNYIVGVATQMFNSRMSELAQKPDCPFAGMELSYGDYLLSSTVETFDLSGTAKDGKDREAYAAAIRELRRVKEFGFTATEYVRAKDEFMSMREKEYSNRDKRKNTNFYNDCLSNFLQGYSMPDADTEYQIWQQVSQMIPLEAVNQTLQEGITIDQDKNLVTYSFAQDKEGKADFTADDMKKTLTDVRAEKLEAWVDNTKNEPIMAQMPKAGTIKKEVKNEKLGFTELQLSNGAKVLLKKTDFKDDEVLLQGWAEGGKSRYGEKDYSNLKVFDYIASGIGLGNFTNNELEKAMAGKQAGIGLSLGNRVSYVSGNSTPKDLETMLQLLYLHFTAPKKDENTYTMIMQQLQTVLKNRDLKPETQFGDSVNAVLYAHNLRNKAITVDDLPNISNDRVMEIIRENYSSANNFTFTIIGNYDEQNIRQLVCQYIASMPANGKALKSTDVRTYFSGKQDCQFTRKMETPKPNIRQCFIAPIENTIQNEILADYLGEYLSNKLLKSVREDAGAAYSVGAAAQLTSDLQKKDYIMLHIVAPISAPEKTDLALDLIKKDIDDATKTIDADIVAKIKANFLKDFDVKAKTNSYWQVVLQDWAIFGKDTHSSWKQAEEAVTPEQISTFLKTKVLSAGNFMNVVMRPE